ncbi:MAG: TRAP transporter small permease, partial [Pelagibacterales bacterium]|nr:TRAP transporter small permease [Pelagibacterales bacterium]
MGIRDKIDRFLGWTLVVIMSLMVVNVLWQVFSRFVLGDPSSYT